MGLLIWIGIAFAAWFTVSVAVGFALAWMIGRGWVRAPQGRDLAGMGFRVD